MVNDQAVIWDEIGQLVTDLVRSSAGLVSVTGKHHVYVYKLPLTSAGHSLDYVSVAGGWRRGYSRLLLAGHPTELNNPSQIEREEDKKEKATAFMDRQVPVPVKDPARSVHYLLQAAARENGLRFGASSVRPSLVVHIYQAAHAGEDSKSAAGGSEIGAEVSKRLKTGH